MIRRESLNVLESLALLQMTLFTEALLILACVGTRGVSGAPISDALHPRPQVAHLLRNLLLRSRIADNHLIQMIIHMVDTG